MSSPTLICLLVSDISGTWVSSLCWLEIEESWNPSPSGAVRHWTVICDWLWTCPILGCYLSSCSTQATNRRVACWQHQLLQSARSP